MRKDQVDRLELLSEDVADQFLIDADPTQWVGTGKLQADMTKDERGDSYWCRKVAVQTGALLARIIDLRDRDKGQNGGGVLTPDEDAEKDLKRFEKQARELLHVVSSR